MLQDGLLELTILFRGEVQLDTVTPVRLLVSAHQVIESDSSIRLSLGEQFLGVLSCQLSRDYSKLGPADALQAIFGDAEARKAHPQLEEVVGFPASHPGRLDEIGKKGGVLAIARG
jgi:hypothetical protein